MRIIRTLNARGLPVGFTLAELMMVVTIMAMLLTMSVAAFNSMVQSKGVEGAKKAITGAIFTARMKAIRDKCEVTCIVAPDAAMETAFVKNSDSGMLYCANRLVRFNDPSDVDSFDKNARKSWAAGQYANCWAFICSGVGSGYPAVKIAGSGVNSGWMLPLSGAFSRKPVDNSVVAILPSSIDQPVPEQWKVTSDMSSGAWDILPRFIDVEGTGFPITFRPDGSGAFPQNVAKIKLRDTRSDTMWTWFVSVDRAAGRVTECAIPADTEESTVYR